jgi:hypothetical protein
MSLIRSGLFRRVATVMGVLALGPVLLLSWRILTSNRRAVQDAVLELHVTLAGKTAERTDAWVSSVDQRVRVALLPHGLEREAGSP